MTGIGRFLARPSVSVLPRVTTKVRLCVGLAVVSRTYSLDKLYFQIAFLCLFIPGSTGFYLWRRNKKNGNATLTMRRSIGRSASEWCLPGRKYAIVTFNRSGAAARHGITRCPNSIIQSRELKPSCSALGRVAVISTDRYGSSLVGRRLTHWPGPRRALKCRALQGSFVELLPNLSGVVLDYSVNVLEL